jgi:N-acetylmuramoyl-L-alanine amidase CwlD
MLKDKRLFTMILSSLFLCGVLSSIPVFAQDNSTATERISGSNRYATSMAISKAGWSQAATVIIVSGIDYPDALAASALSKSKDAPILLTDKNALEPSTLAEINRLKATKALLIGGTGVIGTGVENQLKTLKIDITRIGGSDRYDTSKKVAEMIGVTNGIIMAANLDFPDPLSIAPIAAMKGMPILLTPKNSLNPNIATFIKGKNIPVSYLVGGTGVLGTSIASSVVNSKRLSGDDRYATNLSINNEFAGDFSFDTVYLASGNDFPDALSGSALATKNNAPIFLTDKNSISDATVNFIKSKNVKHVVILGGTGSISQSVENTVSLAINSLIVNSTSVSLNKNTDALKVGEADTLSAAVAPENATNKAVIWTTSNDAIAAVDNTGKITALNAGTAIITATTADGSNNATCAVTVTIAQVVNVSAVSLTTTTDELTVGAIYNLIATVTPDTATNKAIIWTSSNDAIASVDNTGKVTGVSAGTAVITATTEDGGKTATWIVTVSAAANPIVKVSSISLNKTSDALSVSGTDILTEAGTDTLTANVAPDTATNKTIIWTSSNNVIVVDNTGKITAKSPGTATITATTADGNKTASCAVTVAIAPVAKVTSMSLNETTDTLTIGGTDTLTATIAPKTANEAVDWTSSNDAVVAVDNTGKITAISVGTAIITAMTPDENYIATCTVTVTKKASIKIAIDPGHGGYDAGAVGPTGILEKNVNLAIALKVGKILQQNGIDVVYTRTSDNVSWPSDVVKDLQTRCDIANNANVNYFVCIHANSYTDPTVNGTETYYLSGSTEGQKLAQSIQQELVKANGLQDRGIKTANYYVLKNTNVPAILTEVAFISNPSEESLLNSNDFQEKSAEGIANGILKAVN